MMNHGDGTERDTNLLFLLINLLLWGGGSFVWADWESDANARIEQIRKRDMQIIVVNQGGNPVPDITVQIQQVKHRFAFGSCLAYSPLATNTNYQNFVRDHFEWAVCENESKWPANESSRDSENYSQADYMYNWCTNNGIIMRGHTLFWEQTSMVQTWVQNLPYAAYPTSSELLTEVDERIDSAVNHFRNKFEHWDVDNEMLPTSSGYEFYDRLGETGRVHMFQRANSVDPDCMLFMNEYSGNSFGGYDGWTYRDRANSLIGLGAPIHGLGIQGHVSSPFDPQRYYDSVLQPLTAVGLPIWVTEFDVEQADVNQRANDLENFFRICFSHSSVDGILMWGFWQGSMWRTNAYIVNNDWTLNAAGQRYEDLLEEWTTADSSLTSGNGIADFRGFHGLYEITLSVSGQPAEVTTIDLEPGTGTALFEIETLLEAPDPNLIPPLAPTGLTATEGDETVWLDWNDNTEPDLDGYHVYRSQTSGSGYAKISTSVVTDSDYIDTAVINGTTYYYVVTAVDTLSNESGYSNEDRAVPFGRDPYPGPGPHPIPGRIEAENYDTGGEGLSFHDTDSENEGQAYRTDGVDVEVCGEGGYNVGWIFAGEWLEYTVDAAFTGQYDIELRVASQTNGGNLHIEFGGTDATGTISFPATGGWQNYTSVFVNDVSLTAGEQIMRISMDSTYWNINWLEFSGQPALYGDFSGNGTVNLEDLPLFMDHWMTDDCGWLDVNADCRIDLTELAEVAGNWLF